MYNCYETMKFLNKATDFHRIVREIPKFKNQPALPRPSQAPSGTRRLPGSSS